MKDNNSLAHPTWDGRYHILFAPEDRRKIIYGKYRYGNRKFWCRGYYVNRVGRWFKIYTWTIKRGLRRRSAKFISRIWSVYKTKKFEEKK